MTEAALRTAKAVVVLWSPRAVVSRWVRAEATLADRNRTLVPCMIEPCERPIMFELTQTAELSHWRGDAQDRAWLAFLEDVTRFVSGNALASPQPAGPASARTVGHGGPPTLAVLPFANRSGLAEDEAFAVGMAEDIVAALAHSPDIKMLAASATAPWSGKAIDVREVGRALGARYLLEGNLRRIGETLRVAAQIVEAETGAVLWTKKFDRPLVDLAALQEELVAEVAAHLRMKLRIIESSRALTATGELSAHQLLLRAEAYLGRDLDAGLRDARRAVEISPESALAHAVLASALSYKLLLESEEDDPALRAEALAEVARALAVGRQEPAALWRCASTLALLDQPEEAHHHIDRVLTITPESGMAYFVLAIIHLRTGRSEDAIASLDMWDRLSPGSSLIFQTQQFRALAEFEAGRIEEAFAAIDQSIRLNPEQGNAHAIRAALKQLAGSVEEARGSIRKLRSVDPTATVRGYSRQMTMVLAADHAASLSAAFQAAWTDTPTS